MESACAPRFSPLKLAEGADPVALGIECLCTRSWFEAHELLELAWKHASGPRRVLLQGLIQGAVSLEHLRRQSPRSARGQWEKARQKLLSVPEEPSEVDTLGWVAEVDRFYGNIQLDRRVEGAEGLEPLPPESSWPTPLRR